VVDELIPVRYDVIMSESRRVGARVPVGTGRVSLLRNARRNHHTTLVPSTDANTSPAASGAIAMTSPPHTHRKNPVITR
jgi:hypothetical protein